MAKFALCIGINDYPGTGSDLAGCVNDANDWSKELSRRGFQVDRLLDRKANGKGMRAAMTDAVTKARSGDTVVIQYSGHGSYVPDDDGDEPDGTDECLCPHDISSNGPLTDDEIFDLYSARPAGSAYRDDFRLVPLGDCRQVRPHHHAAAGPGQGLPGPEGAFPAAGSLPLAPRRRQARQAARGAQLQPPGPLRLPADVRLPGHRVQLSTPFSRDAPTGPSPSWRCASWRSSPRAPPTRNGMPPSPGPCRPSNTRNPPTCTGRAA